MPNLAVLAPPESLFKLKFHQVAIYHSDPESAVEFWEAAGFQDWTRDECVLRGTYENDETFLMKEREYFNYDILPLEFCYFQYSTGVYKEEDGRDGEPPFLALMAAYVDNLEATMTRIGMELGLHPYKVYDSVEHRNPYLTEGPKAGMRFHKCLYDTANWLGFDVKLTQRVMPGDHMYPAPLTDEERATLA